MNRMSANLEDKLGPDHRAGLVSIAGTHEYDKPLTIASEYARPFAQPSRKEKLRRQLNLEAEDFKRNLDRFSLRKLPNPSLGLSIDAYRSFALHLKSSTRICALLGAGLSASSGVPTFGGTDTLWRGIPQKDLASPYAFRDDPVLVWHFHASRRQIALNAVPNDAHCALAELGKYKDFMAITQNIDGKTLARMPLQTWNNTSQDSLSELAMI
jgi:hypothetical protein